jgi:MFS family permease
VLVRRFSEGGLVRAGVVIYVAGLLLMAAWEHAIAAYAGLAITSVGMGLFSPSMNALTSRQATEADRGTVMGLAQSSGSVGRILGPVCAGGLYVAVAPAAPFVAGAILMALCIFLIAGATAAQAPPTSAGEPAR